MRTSTRRHVAFAFGLSAVIAMSGFLLNAAPPQAVGTWEVLGTTDPSSARSGAATATLEDDTTLIAGGRMLDGTVTDSVLIYDPTTNASTVVGQLASPRVNAAAARLDDGRVLIVGGEIADLLSADAEIFDPFTGTSTVVANNMAAPRTRHSATRLADGKVLIVGGVTPEGVTATAEVFDPETGSILEAGSMTTPRAGASATLLIDNRVLVAGGNDGAQDLASAELFYPDTQEFFPVDTALTQARAGHTAVLLPHNGAVLIAGGTASGAPVNTTDLFLPTMFPDPYTWSMGTFGPAEHLTHARSQAVSGPMGDDGYAFVAGGGAAEGEAYAFVTLKTDKDDYAPGQAALITGSGWHPGEEVTLVFQEDPAVHPDYTLTLTADGDGNISHDAWAPERHDLGVRFYLMATGAQSHRRAQTTFTDGQPAITTVSQTPFSPNQASSSGVKDSTDITARNQGGGALTGFEIRIRVGGSVAGNLVRTFSIGNLAQNTNVIRTWDGKDSASVFVGDGLYTARGFATTAGENDTASDVRQIVIDNTNPTATLLLPTNGSTVSGNFILSASPLDAGGNDGNVASVEFYVDGNLVATDINPGSGWESGNLSAGSYSNGSHTWFVRAYDKAGNNADSAPFTFSIGAGGPTKLAFTSSAFTGTIDQCFGPVQIQTQNASNVATNVTSNTTVGLATDGTGAFFSNNTCTVGISSVSIATGASSASFYYKATARGDGTHDLTVSATGLTGASQTQTINKAPTVTTVTINGGPFFYTGAAQTPATVTVTGPGGLSLTPAAIYANNTNAGTATASYSYAGDANYEASSDSKNFTINKAVTTTTVTINGGPFFYTGAAQTPATVAVTGPGLNLTPTAVYANNVNAGLATASYSYAGDANYEASSDSKNFTINKAVTTTTVTINGGPFFYTGAAQTPATVAVTAPGLNLTPTAVYANNVNAGTATASYNYAGDANYEASSDSKNFTINKAVTTTTVTINGGPFFYTGAAQTPATVTVTGPGLNLTPTAVYANNVNAGLATASYSYAGDANYEASSDSKNFTINKAVTITTVTINGGPFFYTGAAQTPATVTVTGDGGLSLTPAATYANNTNAGTATASYDYAGDANYEASSDSKNFTINKAVTTTTVTINGGPFFYTGAAQTPATVTVTGDGGLSLTPAATYANNTNAGTATASYDYAGDANYEASSDSKNFTINKAVTITTVTINGGPFFYTGAAQTPATVEVTGPGALNLTPAATYANNTNAGTATASYDYAGDANYEASSDSKNFTINKAATITTVTINGGPFFYTGAAQTPATVTVTGDGGLSLTPAATYANNTNAGTATASYDYAGDANYEASSDSKNFTINKAVTTTTVTINGGPFFYTGAAQTPATVAVTGPGLNLTPAATYANNTNAGTATASYDYAGDANYEASSDSKNFTINKAVTTTTVTINGGPFFYTGAAQTPATVTVTGDGGLNLTPTAVYANNVNAGLATASYNYAGGANYEPSSDSKNFTINKAVTITTVTINGGPFFYTGAAQTPATVTVTGPGALNLSPTAVYVNNVNAGLATASYNYAGGANYEPSSDSENFTISPKPATWTTNPASKTLLASDPVPLTTGFGSGFLAADGVAATYTRAAGETVAGNPYHITATLGATGLLTNYAITNLGANFTIGYATTGMCLGSPGHQVLQPLNIDGTSVVKKGSTVPVKFRVCDANGNSIGTAGVVANFQLVQVIDTLATNTVNEDPLSTTPDAAFRWSSSDQQWIFNLSTKNLANGKTYAYRITLNDGSTINFQFGTKQ